MPIGLTALDIRTRGKPIICRKCGHGGGTLRKDGDNYVHDRKCPARPRSRLVTKEELEKLRKK